MVDYIQANTCGRLHDAREPSLSPLNRSFLYGDAIYEVWRTYDGVLFAFEEHWERLQRSAAALHFELPLSREETLAEIGRTATAFRTHTGHVGPLYVRLQVARGGGPIGLDPALAGTAEWVCYVQALHPAQPKPERAGFHLRIARNLHRNPPEALNPAWKTGNYLNNILCLREARAAGADEVLMLNQAGQITEAAVCNVFFVRGRQLVTPPTEAGILHGVTRRLICSVIAPSAEVEVVERMVEPAELEGFDECFLSSTTRDIAPVERIDEHAYSTGPKTVTARLKHAFAEYASAYARMHAELRI
ncbi:MAG: aminotransferase class IV [Verrucomicrobia bacterium]|nr:MAG: aminotransferase class IV [Verrucomicrobiota bacterium]